jgi:hypothetical protein
MLYKGDQAANFETALRFVLVAFFDERASLKRVVS